MNISIEDKRKIRLEMLKNELLFHLETDKDIEWNFSGSNKQYMENAIHSFFENHENIMMGLLFTDDD